MAILNWGDLTKSQVDNETIESAIARIIQQHNENEESHLLPGQSLQSHKASIIIDHLAKSIIEDKYADDSISFEKLKFNFFIVSTDEAGLNKSVSSGNYIVGNLYESQFLIQSLNDENLCYVYSSFGNLPSVWVDENIVFEVVAKRVGTALVNVKWVFGVGSVDLVGDVSFPQFGFYFDCLDNKVYAFYWSSGGLVVEAIMTNISNIYLVCKVILQFNILRWFINGIEKKSVLNPVFNVSNGASIYVGADYNVSGVPREFYVRSICYSQNQKY